MEFHEIVIFPTIILAFCFTQGLIAVPVATENGSGRYNILAVTCHVMDSHKKSVVPLYEYLSEFGGHNVTILTTFYAVPPMARGQVTMTDLVISTTDRVILDHYVHGNSTETSFDVWSMGETSNWDIIDMYDMAVVICRLSLEQHPDVYRSILDTRWDVIVIDTDSAFCGYVIAELASDATPAVKLLYSTFTPLSYTQRHVGIPSAISDAYSWTTKFDHRSFVQRMQHSLWFQLLDYCFTIYYASRMQTYLFDTDAVSRLRRIDGKSSAGKGGAGAFSWWKSDQSSSFTFYDYPDDFGIFRPHVFTEIGIGELQCGREMSEGAPPIVVGSQLPQSYLDFVSDDASEGTIIMALGHYVSWDDIPIDVSLAFYSTFRKLSQYRIIWQYLGNLTLTNAHSTLVNSSNILLVDWMPQLELLRHEKTRLIISQMGIKSAKEIVCEGIPFLALPTWADQPLTARLLANRHRGGKLIHRNLITEDYIANLMGEVLSNQDFHRSQLAKLKVLIEDKILNARNLAKFWIEYSVRNRGLIPILTVRGRYLGFLRYYCVDVVFTMGACPRL